MNENDLITQQFRNDRKTRNKAEGLSVREQCHSSFYENIPAMAHSIDTLGRIVRVSDRWLETLGYGCEEVIGRKSTEFLTDDSRRYAEESVLPEFFRTGECRDVPYQFVKKNGEIVEVLLSASCERDSEGGIIRSSAIMVDVTERKRAEDRLRKESERGKLLLELYYKAPRLTDKELYDYVLEQAVRLTESSIGFFHIVSDDQKTVILTTWNGDVRMACSVAHASHYPVEKTGNWADCIRHKSPVVYNDFKTAPNRNGLPEGHVPVRRFMSIPVLEGDKVRFIFGVGNKAAPYEEHDLVQLQLVAFELRRLTEKRQSDEALRKSEEKFRMLAETSRGALFLYQDERIVYVNPSMARLTGYSEQELLLMDFWEWVHPKYQEQIKAFGLARQRGENVPPQYELRYVTAEGEEKWAIISAGYVDYHGKPAGIATIIDIAERKRIEDELQRAHEVLEQSVRERTADLADSLASLRKSEKRYRLLFENMLDGLAHCRMLYDEEGRPVDFVYLAVNRAFGRLTGLENVTGKRVTEVIPGIKESRPELFEIYGRVALTGRPERFEIEIKPLGKWFSVSAYSSEKDHFVAVIENITDRKKCEEVLGRYELLAANSRDIILFMRRDDGRILEANAAAVQAYRYNRDELLALTIHDLRAPETGALTIGQMNKADYHGILFETVHMRKDGSTFPVEVSSQGWTIHGNRTLISIIRDITERKRIDSILQNMNAELEVQVIERTADLMHANELLMEEIEERKQTQEALRKSEAKYRALFENSMDAIFLTVPDGKISAANQAACEMFGMTEEDLIKSGRSAIIDPTDSRLPAALEERLRRGRISCELTFVRKDGTKFPAETSSCILADGAKSFVMLRDITARKQAEEALRESSEFSRQVIASANEGLIVMDTGLRFLVWNPYMEQLTGLPADKALGRHPLELFPSLVENGIFENIEKARDGQKSDPCEHYIHSPYNGRSYWILTTHAPLRDAKGELIGVIGTARDITVRKLAEDSLRNYTRRLIEMEEDLRTKLAAELHDEIGRDLTTLGFNCTIIGHKLPAELNKGLVTRVEDSRRLIEEVTRSVRNIMNRLRPPMLDDFGLPAALSWYGDLFAKRTGIAVRTLIDETCPRLTQEKETALFRIAQEALTNSAKHAAARNITLMFGCSSGMLRLSIGDDGKGFVREPAATIRTDSGWGLRIMRERAKLIGAGFTVDSIPDVGTTVSVDIRED